MARTKAKAKPRTALLHITPTRKRKATNRKRKHKIKDLILEDKRLACYELSLEYYSEQDIAEALELTQPRVSQLINEQVEINRERLEITSHQWRTREVDRIDRFVINWYLKAKTDPKAAEVLGSWLDRKYKILGLYINKQEWSGPNGGPIEVSASNIDITKLDDEELLWLNRIVNKSMIAPDPRARLSAIYDAQELAEGAPT